VADAFPKPIDSRLTLPPETILHVTENAPLNSHRIPDGTAMGPGLQRLISRIRIHGLISTGPTACNCDAGAGGSHYFMRSSPAP